MIPPGSRMYARWRCGLHTTNILPAQDPMFVPAEGEGSPVRGDAGDQPADRPAEPLVTARAALAEPGLVVLAGGPGIGRTTILRRLGESFRGPVFAGGGLAMLRAVPGFALARAVKVRLPTQDQALLAEAVRSRVRNGLLLLDDLQWVDRPTLGALPAIAAHCRIAVTLRTPHQIDVDELRRVATAWLTVLPLPAEAGTGLVARIAPGLSPAVAAEVVRRAGGIPLAVEALARHAAAAGEVPATDGLAYAVAGALADLTRWRCSAPAWTSSPAPGWLRWSRTAPRRCRPTSPRSPPGCSTPTNARPCTGAWPTWCRPGKPPANRSWPTSAPSTPPLRPAASVNEPSCSPWPASCPAPNPNPTCGCAPPPRPWPSAGRRPPCARWARRPAPTPPSCAARRCYSSATRPPPWPPSARCPTRRPPPSGPPGTGCACSASSPATTPPRWPPPPP